ncbi:unnamed protein product [Arctogadus glacialis]
MMPVEINVHGQRVLLVCGQWFQKAWVRNVLRWCVQQRQIQNSIGDHVACRPQWSSTAVLHVQANGIGGAFFWACAAADPTRYPGASPPPQKNNPFNHTHDSRVTQTKEGAQSNSGESNRSQNPLQVAATRNTETTAVIAIRRYFI